MADHSKAEQFRYGHVVVKDTNDMGNIIFIGKVTGGLTCRPTVHVGNVG